MKTSCYFWHLNDRHKSHLYLFTTILSLARAKIELGGSSRPFDARSAGYVTTLEKKTSARKQHTRIQPTRADLQRIKFRQNVRFDLLMWALLYLWHTIFSHICSLWSFAPDERVSALVVVGGAGPLCPPPCPLTLPPGRNVPSPREPITNLRCTSWSTHSAGTGGAAAAGGATYTDDGGAACGAGRPASTGRWAGSAGRRRKRSCRTGWRPGCCRTAGRSPARPSAARPR